ncbi:MAG: hypothetical protein HYR64_00635 [Fimbriimonas ginsengisoli]|uniref:Secretin/TonB short N-terminal domain-containing protein n=1 Tax=Fimbriimonas ginsengisoli TaxID=1005039 RepID=A0A931LT07_FIMGI|nr:hypothetical protein [Fimbriimonas ginsengisoli]
MLTRLSRWISASAFVGAASAALAQGTLTGVQAHSVGLGVEIQINGSGLKQPKVFHAYGHRFTILEFDAKLAGHPSKGTVNHGGVASYSYGWYSSSPPKVRVLVRCTAAQEPWIAKTSDGWRLCVNVSHDAFTADSSFPTTVPPLVYSEKTSSPATATRTAQATTTAPEPTTKLSEATAKASIADVKTSETPVEFASIGGRIAVAPGDGTPVPSTSLRATAARPARKAKAESHVARYESPRSGRVTLDFANTEVVQVLKALALQGGVNIVTSPEVKGTVTVALDGVSVKEALDLVTTMAGVRYAKVGNTYIVTSADRFPDAIKQISGRADESTETRVVPLFSGMGSQIKAAIVKALQPDAAGGRYDLILPSEQLTVAKTETLGGPSGAGTAGATPAPGAPVASAASGTPQGATMVKEESKSADQKKDSYVVLVGSKSRLNEVEPAVKELDAQICHSLLIPIPEEHVAMRAVYHTVSNSAKNLLAAVVEPERAGTLGAQPYRTTVGHVEVYASTTSAQGEQLLVLNGPKHEVDRLLGILTQLDDSSLTTTSATVYEVKYADPRALKDDLAAQIPGLHVTIPPASAGNQGLYQANATRQDVQTQGAGAITKSESGMSAVAQPSASTGASSSTTNSGGQGGSSPDQGSPAGLAQPYTALESGAVPMRLVLKGTPQLLKQALDYLRLVDVAPRQVALEMRVMEMSKNDAINAGIDWSIFTGGAVKMIGLHNAATTSTNNSATVGLGNRLFQGSVTAQLDKLAGSGKLIARPNMIATDGRQTELFVGDAIRYVESKTTSQNGVSITTNTVRVGVRLAVLPRVGGDGSVTMDLRPVVSFLTKFVPTGDGGQLPQTSERVAQSTLTVKDGETIAIGGLIQDQDRKDVQGLPFLMDLPIIGHLFKSTTTTKSKVELAIFLTVRIIDGPVSASSPKLPMNDEAKKN